MKETNRFLITIATMLGTALAALDSTVVGTAMPQIIGQLGGLSLYSWVFSIYLLTSTATVPVFGKLADIFGRKPTFLVGAGIFLAGSALCGLAGSIEQLILFRGIQGIGAGCVLPVTLTIIGDIFTVEQRARVQGIFSAVWGVAGIVGPAVGGVLVDTVGWRWVFYVNLPFGLLACALLVLFLHERVEARQRRIDYVGSATLMVGVSALLFALQQGGSAYPWTAPPILGALAVAVVALVAFAWNEPRAPEPMLPLSLFRHRVIAVSCAAAAMAGTVLFGVTSFVPLFLQGVQGNSAFAAGMLLMPMSIAWPVASTLSGRFILRLGYRFSAVLGMVLVLSGTALLLFLNPGTPPWYTAGALVLVGLGMGFSTSAFIISVQNSVDWGQRGVATAAAQFCRTIGGTLGVALMGGLLNARMGGMLGVGEGAGGARPNASVLLDAAARATLSSETLVGLRAALDSALGVVFWLTALAALAGLVVAACFPGGSIRPRTATTPTPEAASAGAPVGTPREQVAP